MILKINIILRSPFNVLHSVLVIGERSEPLSRVFNDQPRGIYIYMVESVRTYVPNTHARVSVLRIKFKS